MPLNVDLVDKNLVHKQKDENVLIYNLRRALPRRINAELMEAKILNNLCENDKNFLFLKSEKNKNPDDYILKILPHEVDEETLNDLINPGDIIFKDLKYLMKYFHRDKGKKKFYLIEDEIDEEDELKILKIFNLKNWYINSNEKAKISDILEKNKDVKKDDVFFCNMFVKIDHVFFFEHPNEHVPALMIIEAARQFLIANCHKYFNVPLKGYNFILEGMEINFLSYSELNYPIKMIGIVNEIKTRKDVLSFLDINITVWQKSKEVATINFIGKVIKAHVFKELRKDKAIYKRVPRFHPRPLFYNNIFIRRVDKTKFLCDLIDLSEDGFSVKFNKNYPENVMKKNKFEFFIFFQEVGVIHGGCSVKWMKFESSTTIAGFKITELTEDDKENLHEVLRRFCYIREDREIL